MIDNYSLYGVHGADVYTVSSLVNEALNIPMEIVESGGWGDYFGWNGDSEEKMFVYTNLNPGDEEGTYYNEKKYEDFPILIALYDPPNMSMYDQAFVSNPDINATLLKRRIDDYQDPNHTEWELR